MELMSKSIVNLVDFACIMSRPAKEELEAISNFTSTYEFAPNLVTDVFKNRRGRWTMVRIWSYNDLGSCRREDLFITTPDLRPIEDFKVIDFVSTNFKDYRLLCDEFNRNITEDSYQAPEQYTEIKPDEIMENPGQAFQEELDRIKMVTDKPFMDFIKEV